MERTKIQKATDLAIAITDLENICNALDDLRWKDYDPRVVKKKLWDIVETMQKTYSEII